MQYRKFGKSGLDVSILGFGCMRLPVNPPEAEGKDSDVKSIDEPEAIKMIRYAIDNGVNYVDTAYLYHEGASESLVAKALRDGYREKVMLATKLPIWLVKCKEDFDKFLDEQLAKLETEYLDVYLLHALDKSRWNKVMELDLLESLKKAIDAGKIKYGGFSFHEDIDFFPTILDAFDWGMCQIMFNYMEDRKWEKYIKYAHEKGIAVVVMEPLLGGKLACRQPEPVRKVWRESATDRNPVEWALKWVYNYPEVTLALSGMSTMDQVKDNVRIAEDSSPNALSENELQTIEKVRAAYESLIKVKCTGCKYCQPCPNNVSIPQIFEYYNNASAYNANMEFSKGYESLKKAAKDASLCVECRKCEEACPQKLPVIKYLKEAHASLNNI